LKTQSTKRNLFWNGSRHDGLNAVSLLLFRESVRAPQGCSGASRADTFSLLYRLVSVFAAPARPAFYCFFLPGLMPAKTFLAF
jgi:hypothetical protein